MFRTFVPFVACVALGASLILSEAPQRWLYPMLNGILAPLGASINASYTNAAVFTAIIVGYSVFQYFIIDWSSPDPELIDSPYFLGFVFTLISLVVSFAHVAERIPDAAQSSDAAVAVVSNAGIALISSIFGIICRFFFVCVAVQAGEDAKSRRLLYGLLPKRPDIKVVSTSTNTTIGTTTAIKSMPPTATPQNISKVSGPNETPGDMPIPRLFYVVGAFIIVGVAAVIIMTLVFFSQIS